MPSTRLPIVLTALALLVGASLFAAGPFAARPAAAVHRPATSGPAGVRPVPGEVLRPFEQPATPYGPGHRGVDLAAAAGEPVRAALPGRISFAGPVAGTGWVTVDHGGGLSTTYGDVIPARERGQPVDAGDLIGRLAASAGHLDWGARHGGGYLDPLTLLRPWQAHLADPAAVPRGDVRLSLQMGWPP